MPRLVSLPVASIAALWIAVAVLPEPAIAQPVAKTVPWVATNLLVPHDTWSGKQIALKGTCTNANQYTWNPGDGSPAVTAAIVDPYVIEKLHTYTGAVGTLFTARLTCTNTAGPTSDIEEYYVRIQNPPPNLPVEVNVAIDEGLWYLHKTMQRTPGPPTMGQWPNPGGYYSPTTANINAFEVNGHLESGPASNPYTETVARGLRQLFGWLTPMAVSPQTNPAGTFNPDANGNGQAVRVNQFLEYYQGGMFMDAIVASGTPAAVTTTGPAGVIGQTYATIVQDMTDAYAYCQYDSSPAGGGWRYSCNEWPDNSACQWAGIGITAAERNFGAIFHSIARSWNNTWLIYSQNAANGVFGYTDTNPIFGPYATTPSGMVQLAMVGIGRGNARWDKAETFMRDNFGNVGGYFAAPKDYTYGLFSLTKSLLFHDSNADKVAEPIVLLQSLTPGVPPIDWYAAEVSSGAPTNGVARHLVSLQSSNGSWSMADPFSGPQSIHHTGWAIIMLRKTVVDIPPVAVATAFPNPSLAGATVTLDGTGSFHPDPLRKIVLYEWDLDNNGTYETTGSVITNIFPVTPPPPPPDVIFPVKLRVTDNNPGTPQTAVTTINVVVSTPPVAPSASAGGPYAFCIGQTPTPWRLNGMGSVNPDDGVSEPGRPPDAIIAWDWDVDGDNDFNDFAGAQPDVTAYYTGLGVGDYLVQLRVTDNTAASFPSSGKPNLTDIDSAQLRVRPAGDPLCAAAAFRIEIKPPSPGVAPVSLPLNARSKASMPVAILSSATFNAPTEVKATTLTFGRTGSEKSLVTTPSGRPQCGTSDVNGDLIGDLVCHFYTVIADFQCGNTLGYLKGETIGGQLLTGSDPIKVVGQGCNP